MLNLLKTSKTGTVYLYLVCMTLQVLASAAVELSQPKEAESSGPVLKEVRERRERGSDQVTHSTSRMHPALMRKPWEGIIKERLKAKTRIISKASSGTSLLGTSEIRTPL